MPGVNKKNRLPFNELHMQTAFFSWIYIRLALCALGRFFDLVIALALKLFLSRYEHL